MSARFGLYALFVFLLVLPIQAAAQPAVEMQRFDPDPLRPANTSSPRDTLRSFETNSVVAHRAFLSGAPAEVIEKLLRRVRDTVDFSQLPARGRDAKQVETLLALREILDRIELPPEEAIPGEDEVANIENPIASWTIPNTRITIEKIEEGPRAGEFLFSAETVDRIEEFYEDAKHLPYRPGALVNLFEEYKHRPGRMVPTAWANALPSWSKTVVLDYAIWQWLGFAVVATSAFVFIRWLLRWGKRWDKRHRNASASMRFGRPLAVLVSIAIFYACRYVFVSVFRLLGDFGEILTLVLWGVIFAGIGWLIVLVAGRIADFINEARQFKRGGIDAQLVRVLLRLLSIVGLVFLIIYAADFYGIPLTPVVASLGIGGLAIALAVRPTLENVIGGLTLFMDKPVRVGDFCRYGDQMGSVEEIGLRSTRVRALDRTIVTIPNAEFSQMKLVNFDRRDLMLYKFMLGLRYETTSDQLRYVLAKVREMLLGHPRVMNDPARVRFLDFGDYSLDLEIFAYINSSDWNEYLGIREDLNLRIMDIVAEAGTDFAFPSQTAYLSRDTGLDGERGRHAEEEVQGWRSKGQLPFPNFDEGLRWEKEDILDYPPKGSPHHKPREGLSETEPEGKSEDAKASSQPHKPGKI